MSGPLFISKSIEKIKKIYSPSTKLIFCIILFINTGK